MRRLLALSLVLMLGLVLPAFAGPDPASKRWRQNQKTYDAQEDDFWEELRKRMDEEVLAIWQAQWRTWRSNGDPYVLEAEDLAPLRVIFAECADLVTARIEADLEYAQSGSDQAAKELFDAVLDLTKEVEKLEKAHIEARAVQLYYYYDQMPAMKLRGLWRRLDGLGRALVEATGGVALLIEDGWAKAKKGDKKRSWYRRVAVLDALGHAAASDPRAYAHLEAMLASEVPAVRIGALENCAPLGAEAVQVLQPLLGDAAPVVRRSLLHAIRTRAVDTPAWIPHVLEVYPGLRGLLRARALLTLQRLTGERIGDDLEAWRAWLAKNEAAIGDGSWQRTPPAKAADGEGDGKGDGEGDGDGEDAPQAEPLPTTTPSTSFYGVGAPSRHIVFVVDGTRRMGLPADRQTELLKSRRFWLGTAAWRKEYVDHYAVLQEQLGATIEALPDSARLAVVYMHGSTPGRCPVLGAKKPLKPGRGTAKSVLKTVKKGKPEGVLSVEEGLRQAFAVYGIDPLANPRSGDVELDTAYVQNTGWIGGRWGLPEVLLEAFARQNRFYRLQLHVLRYSELGPDSETLMKGLAEATEGTYTHL